MRTTVTIEDTLYQRALEVADSAMPEADLFRVAIEIFIRVRTAQRLAALGDTAAAMEAIPRRHEGAEP